MLANYISALGSLSSNLVHIGPIRSILSIWFTSVQFSPFLSNLVHPVHFGPQGLLRSILSNSAYMVHFGRLSPFWSISVQFSLFGLIWPTFVHFGNVFCGGLCRKMSCSLSNVNHFFIYQIEQQKL